MPIVKKLGQHKLLLDTHVLIWTVLENRKVCSTFRSNLQKAADADRVLVSTISLWEIGMLAARGRIQLDMDVLDWVEQVLGQPGLQLIPISPRVAIQSSRLPGETHGDPADRLLVATAREQNACLVTHDAKILDYGKGAFISVHDPC